MSKKRKNNKKISKRTIIGFLKKNWIMVWLITATLALFTVISFAAYKDTNNRIKRVFVAAKQGTSFFTSNYLIGETNFNSVSFNETDIKTFGVYIRNYDPNTGGVHDGPITYTLNAKLAHMNCNDYDASSSADAAALQKWREDGMRITVSYGSYSIVLTGNDITGSQTGIVLTDDVTGKRNYHQWNVTFDNIALDSDYCVTLEAIPNDGSTIKATLGIGSFPESENEGWTCSISDDRKSQSISSFDAFNYMITGSGGTKLIFSYDATKLEPNPFFSTYNTGVTVQDHYTGSTQTGRENWRSIEIAVQSNVNRYDLQMYKKNSNSPSGWDDLDPENKQWVEFETIQSQSQP